MSSCYKMTAHFFLFPANSLEYVTHLLVAWPLVEAPWLEPVTPHVTHSSLLTAHSSLFTPHFRLHSPYSSILNIHSSLLHPTSPGHHSHTPSALFFSHWKSLDALTCWLAGTEGRVRQDDHIGRVNGWTSTTPARLGFNKSVFQLGPNDIPVLTIVRELKGVPDVLTTMSVEQ